LGSCVVYVEHHRPIKRAGWRRTRELQAEGVVAEPRAAGLPHTLRIHDLRHTCATTLIDRGVHPKAIQHHLGHANIDITMDRYGHPLPDQFNDVAAQLDAAYRQGTASTTADRTPR
jgi:integrase